MAYNFPFSFLCPHGLNNISLSINDRDSDTDDWIIAPGSTPLNPLYHFQYSDRDKHGNYSMTIHNFAHGQRTLGVVDFDSDEGPRLALPWLTWRCKLLDGEGNSERWASDVGTLEGHDMEWQWMGWYRNGYVVRCLDAEDAYTNVCGVIMTNFDTGRIEIPVHVIRDQNGLDEMVVIAMVAMQLQREYSKWNGPKG